MYQNDQKQLIHFFITQIQVILFGLFLIVMLSLGNHLAIYMIYCCPMLFFFMAIEYIFFWYDDKYSSTLYKVFKSIIFIITVPIFFGVFFGVFHNTAKLNYQKVENCFVSGQMTTSLDKFEKYSILYVTYEYEGQQYLGQACSSSQQQGKTTNSIRPYKSYYKNEFESCSGSDTSGNSRLLQSGSSSSSTSSTSNDVVIDNTEQIKLASWLCIERPYDFEQYTEKQSCYVHYFNDENKAKENGKNREQQKDLHNFPLISFQKHPYFPKTDFVFLVLFAFYPMLLSLNVFFQGIATIILDSRTKIRQRFQKLEIDTHQQYSSRQIEPIQQQYLNNNHINQINYNINIENKVAQNQTLKVDQQNQINIPQQNLSKKIVLDQILVNNQQHEIDVPIQQIQQMINSINNPQKINQDDILQNKSNQPDNLSMNLEKQEPSMNACQNSIPQIIHSNSQTQVNIKSQCLQQSIIPLEDEEMSSIEKL